MKSELSNLAVERGNITNEDSFFIEATPEAFEILSSGIYKNQILAPIRELSTNAYDAHVSVGKADVPFEVHIPTRMNPTFGVRDFGPGLSPSEINTVYRGYFKSTKNTSNDFVGCMGLGSKSPFAYIDSFSVTSYQNGKAKFYNCFKNEDNKPTITELGEAETTEPDGVFVSFPVKDYDFYSFRTNCETNYSFYAVKPKFVNYQINVKSHSYTIQNNDFGVLKSNVGESCVIMGNVAYPFSVSDFTSDCSLSSEEKQLVNWGVHLFVNIGDVKPSASRESLSFTKRTMNNIKTALSNVVLKIREEIEKNFSNISSIWDARIKCSELGSTILSKIVHGDSSNTYFHVWNGKKISNHVELKSVSNKPISVEYLTTDTPQYYNRGKYSKTGGVYKKPCDNIYFNNKTLFVVNDLNIGAYTACYRHMQANQIDSLIVLSNDNVQEFKDELEIPTDRIIYASSIPKPEKAPREKSASGKRVTRTTLQTYKLSSFEDVDIDINSESGIYLECSRGTVTFSNGHVIASGELYSFMNSLSTLNFTELIYFVRPSDVEKLKKRSNWVEASSTIEKFVLSKTDLIQSCVFHNTIKSNDKVSNLLTRLKTSRILELKSLNQEAYDLLNYCEKWDKLKYSNDLSSMREMNKHFIDLNIKDINKDLYQTIDDLYKSFIDTYPMLEFSIDKNVDDSYYPNRIEKNNKISQKYVDMINSSKNSLTDTKNSVMVA